MAFCGAEGELLIAPFARDLWQPLFHIVGKLTHLHGAIAVRSALPRKPSSSARVAPCPFALDSHLVVCRGGNRGPPGEPTQSIDGVFLANVAAVLAAKAPALHVSSSTTVLAAGILASRPRKCSWVRLRWRSAAVEV